MRGREGAGGIEDGPAHLFDEAGGVALERLPESHALGRLARHTRMERGEKVERHDGGLVTPMLEAVGAMAVGVAPQVPVERGGVVGAVPREDRQVVRPRQDVDRVELEQALPVEVLAELPLAHPARGPSPRKALRREEDSAGLGRAHSGHHAPTLAGTPDAGSRGAHAPGMLFRLAPIAQSVERFHGKEKVQGSIPCRGSDASGYPGVTARCLAG